MQDWPTWTLSEANAVLPQIIAITEAAVRTLHYWEKQWHRLGLEPFDALRGARRTDLVRADWARRLAELGVQPKGYFVADFQSHDPETLLCWMYGETSITHEHSVWETFADRRLIHDYRRFENHTS